MTNATLKATVAAIAITAGASAWAQTDTTADVDGDVNADVTTQTQADEALEETGDALGAAADATGEAIVDTSDALADTADEAIDETADALDDSADTTANVETDVQPEPEMANSFSGMLVGDIVGQNIVGSNGEDLGTVDYVIDNGGEMAVVVGVGGFLGIGQHEVAIPLSDITQGGEGSLMLNAMTEDDLKALPEVEEGAVSPAPADQPLS